MRRETDAVIAHAQFDSSGLLNQLNRDSGGATVFERVVHCFLRNAIQVAGHGLVMHQNRIGRKLGRDAVTGGNTFGQTVQRLDQTIGLRRDTDFLLWIIARELSTVEQLMEALRKTGVAPYLDNTYSYLAVTRESQYVKAHSDDEVAVVPVIVVRELDHAVPLARALASGGLTVLEITLRSEVALKAIVAIAEALPEVTVGSGTVLTREQMQASLDHGCRFAVSPGATPALLDAAEAVGLPLLPGAANAFYERAVSEHLMIGLSALDILRGQRSSLHSRKLRSFDEPPFR